MRMSSHRPRGTLAAALLLVSALALLASVPAGAEEPKDPAPPGGAAAPGEGGADAGEAPPLNAEEAARIGKLLEAAAKKRKAEEVLPALDEVQGRSHPCFLKPLLKMVHHEVAEVALRAAELLRVHKTLDPKEAAKIAKQVWKEGWTDRANEGRPVVRGRVLLAVGTLAREPIDDRQLGEVEKLWRATIGDPQEANAPALVDVCRYVRITKDKRLCRLLAEELDEPMATAVNSGSNPPAEWWERRWKLWKQVKAEVAEVLLDLTGQNFKDTASAKAWFEGNEREFGFKW